MTHAQHSHTYTQQQQDTGSVRTRQRKCVCSPSAAGPCGQQGGVTYPLEK